MKIKAIKDFKDLKENIKRKSGDEFIVSKERFEEINSKLPGYVEEVIEAEEKPKKRRKSKGE